MIKFKNLLGALPVAMALVAAPVSAASSITDAISNPSGQWAGIDYWGVQVSQFSMFDQLFSFDVVGDSKIDIFIQGSTKFAFSDVFLNGQSIASNFGVNGSTSLKASGYSVSGPVSLRFAGNYTCADCWGDWFGGYVQVTQATIPIVTPTTPTPVPPLDPIPSRPIEPVAAPVPEPASWVMMVVGIGLVGGMMRRKKARASLA